jgi:hypothetical protein
MAPSTIGNGIDNIYHTNKTGGSYALLLFVSVNLPYKQDWRIIYTTFICVIQSPLQTQDWRIICTTFICVSQSPLQTQDWRIICTTFICVSQSPLQTQDYDHIYYFHLCHSISPTNTRLEDHMYYFHLSVNLPYKQDWSIICTAFICVSQSPLQTRLEDHMYCFHLCQSISPTNKTGGSYVLLSFVSVNFPYTHDWTIICTAFICVSQSLLQTRQEDHM